MRKTPTFIRKYLKLLAVLLIWASCTTNKTHTIKTPAPKEFYSKIEIEPELSHLNIIANVRTAELENKLNSYIPELIYEDNNIEDDGYALKVMRKGSIRIFAHNGSIEFQLPLQIFAKASINLGFFKHEQDADFELTPSYLSKISISPDWKINSNTNPNGYQWLTKPKVKIGPIEVDVSPFIEKMLNTQQNKITKEIDQKVAELFAIKPVVENAWQLIQTPISIAEQPSTWLKISPKEVFFLPIHGDTTTLKVGVALKGYTETYIGAKPSVMYMPLPNLSVYPEAKNSFNINMLARISFEEVSAIAKQRITQQGLSFGDEKNKTQVEDVDFYGSGDKLIVKATLSGDVNGVVYLSGKPYYDSTTAAIKVAELDFELETKNQILKTANWLAHGIFTKKIEKAFTFPIKAHTEEAKQFVQKFITNNKVNNYVTINGNIESLTPKKILIVNDYLLLQVAAKGTIELNLSGF